jgi:hypothetical protein
MTNLVCTACLADTLAAISEARLRDCHNTVVHTHLDNSPAAAAAAVSRPPPAAAAAINALGTFSTLLCRSSALLSVQQTAIHDWLLPVLPAAAAVRLPAAAAAGGGSQ